VSAAALVALEGPSGAPFEFMVLFVAVVAGPRIIQRAKLPGIVGLLLAGFAIGPTTYDGRWWHVPNDAPDDAPYVPADPRLAAEFDRLAERSARIDAYLSES
jgi:hypothetical protein